MGWLDSLLSFALALALAAALLVPTAHAAPAGNALAMPVASGVRSDEPQSTASLEPREHQLIAAVNQERLVAGLGALTPSAKLTRAADYHTREMIWGDYFSHESLNGWTFEQRLRRLAGATKAGEVLAYAAQSDGGSIAASEVLQIWTGSPQHLARILGRGYNHIGVSWRTERFRGSVSDLVTVDLARLR